MPTIEPLPAPTRHAASAQPIQVPCKPSLRDILDVGYTAPEMASTAYKAMSCAVSSFEILSGYLPVQDISMATNARYLAQMLALGQTHWSVSRHLLVLISVVRRGKERGLLPSGLTCPFDIFWRAVRKRAIVRVEPLAFQAADLQQLFSSELYVSGHPDPLDPRAGRFWAPLVGLFTGARVQELACAQVSDIEQHDGTWVLRVPSALRGAHATGVGRVRLIPLHPELVRCGFIAYVAQRKLAGHSTLLPMNARSAFSTQPGYAVSSWFARYATRIELHPGLRNLRSLRVTFMLACALSGMGERICVELSGHAPRRYVPVADRKFAPSAEPLLGFLLYWMPYLRFEGLELTHLYVDDPLAGVEEAFPTLAAA